MTKAEEIAEQLLHDKLGLGWRVSSNEKQWVEAVKNTAAALEKFGADAASLDTRRLDALERQIHTGTILWDGNGDFPCSDPKRDGLGLAHRSLRKAIDQCCPEIAARIREGRDATGR